MNHEESQTSHVIPHQLCKLCRRLAEFYSQDIFRSSESYHPGIRGQELNLHIVSASYAEPLTHYDSLAELEQSAAVGCHICSLYSGAGSRNLRPHPSQLKPFVRLRCRREYDACGFLVLEMFVRSIYEISDEKTVSTIHMYDHPYKGYDSQHMCVAPLREMDSYGAKYQWCTTTNCEEGYKMIMSWLRTCIDSHKDCQATTHQVRPSRLLDLNADNKNGIRLVLAEEVRTQPYATLSYRWGTSTKLQLTTLNLRHFRSQIVIGTLPRTIRDAIKVCRRLSVRYLWVDALCIIQDDVNDLALVISQMGSIYANCIFTIAASDSTDSQSGCFRDRWPLQRDECIISTKAGQVVFSVDVYRYETAQDTIESLPLSSRGWVYQERMLSPRTIHFVADEILWDCRQEQKWYNGVEQAPIYGSHALKKMFLVLTKECPQHVRTPVFQFIWSNIIYGYTERELSDENDRLSALAGIYELSTRVFGYNMSYGLVVENLLEELLWCRVSYSDIPDEQPYYPELLGLVPSWTWLSKPLRVEYQDPSFYYDDLLQTLIYSASITRVPPITPFSSITTLTSGLTQPESIGIRCWMQACQLVPYVRRPEPSPTLRWSLVPVTTKPNEPLDTYLVDVQDAIDRCDVASDILSLKQSVPFLLSLRSLYQRNYQLKLSDYIACHPDFWPSLSKKYCCILIKRLHGRERYSTVDQLPIRTTVADFGLICEPIDASKNLYGRVGYFHEMVERLMDHEANIPTGSSGVDHRSPTKAYLAEFGFNPTTINDYLCVENQDKGTVQAGNNTVNECVSQWSSSDEGELPGLPKLLKKLTLFQEGFEELELKII